MTEFMENEEFLTTQEVAARFRVNERTVWKWAAMGRLHPIRTPGGNRRYRKSEIDTFFETRPL